MRLEIKGTIDGQVVVQGDPIAGRGWANSEAALHEWLDDLATAAEGQGARSANFTVKLVLDE